MRTYLSVLTPLRGFAAVLLVLARPIPLPQWNRFFHIVFDAHTVPASLVFLQAMHLFPTSPLNTPSWSPSAEWWMCLLFPCLRRP